MADQVPRLLEVVSGIAKDLGYDETKTDLKPISSGGANYTSRLFSISLSAPGKDDLKLFSKVATLGEKARSMIETQVYEIEITFYTEILPKFRQLEDTHNFSEEDRLVLPKYYGGVADYAEELMVFEDLTAKGFKSFDRFKCFDWEYASKGVEAMATFHALSVAFQRDDPKKYAEFTSKLKITAPNNSIADFFNKCITTAIESTDEIYKTRVELFLHNEMKKATFVKFFNPERRILLTHGDFRPSNILQKVDDDDDLQLAVVDYQMIKQGNPVTDLLYFLICGSDEEFRDNYLHEYFNRYYDSFSETLKRLGIEPDTVYLEEDFREDVREMLPFGLVLATLCLLFVTVEEDSAPKPEHGMDFENIDIKASNQFQVRFNGLVRDYVKWGIL